MGPLIESFMGPLIESFMEHPIESLMGPPIEGLRTTTRGQFCVKTQNRPYPYLLVLLLNRSILYIDSIVDIRLE